MARPASRLRRRPGFDALNVTTRSKQVFRVSSMAGDGAAHAADYPFDIPTSSYVFHPASGEATPGSEKSLRELSRGRDAVLAIGSNASPEQLRRKFGGEPGLADPIPVVRATLGDHDVVYSAHLSRYGAVPATLTPSQGTMVRIFVSFLTERQLGRMHETERVGIAYDAVELSGETIRSELAVPDPVVAYRSSAGPLLWDGVPRALSVIPAEARLFPALTEREVLELIASAFRLSVDALLARVVGDQSFREEVGAWMRGE